MKRKKAKITAAFLIFLVFSLTFNTAYALQISFDPTKDVSVQETSATINWTTDVEAQTQLAYGVTKDLGSTQASSGTAHSVLLADLNPNEQYYYKMSASAGTDAVVSDNSGNFYSFKTPFDTTPPFINVSLPEHVNTVTLDFSGKTEPYAVIHAYVDPLPGQVGPTFFDKQTIADATGSFVITKLALFEKKQQTLVLWARDKIGNTNTFQKTLFVDTKPPVVTVSFNRTMGGVLINGTVDEPVTLEFYSTQEGSPQGAAQKVLTNATVFKETITVQEGSIILTVIARDDANNVAEHSKQFLFFNSPPVFLYPQSLESVYSPASTQDITLYGQVNRQVTVQAFVNGKDAGTVSSDANGSFSIPLTLEKIFNISIQASYTTAGVPTTVVTGATNPTQPGTIPSQPYLPQGLQAWDNTVKLVATDATGQSVTLEGKIKYQLCGTSGPLIITIEKLTPDTLVPKLLLDGTQEQGFNFKLNWSAAGEYQIQSVIIKPRELSPEERKKYDLEYANIIPVVPFLNQDKSKGYVLIKMKINDPTPSGANWTQYDKEANVSQHRKAESIPSSFGGLHDQFCNIPGFGCIRFPLQIEISYTSAIQSGIQSQCWEFESLIEPRVFDPGDIPTGFLKGTIGALNKTIEVIDKILDPLKKIQTYVFYGCAVTWLGKFIFQIKEKWSCEFSGALEGKSVRRLAEQGLCAGDTVCEGCSEAIAARKNVDKASQWVCDRIFCPSAPSLQKFIKDAHAKNPKASTYTGEEKIAKVTADCELADPAKIVSYWEAYAESTDKEECAKPHPYDAKCCIYEYLDKWDSACALMDEARESACLANQNGVAAKTGEVSSKLNCYPTFNAIAGFCEKPGEQQAEYINAGKAFSASSAETFGKGNYVPKQGDACSDWYRCQTKGVEGECPDAAVTGVVDATKAKDNYGCSCNDGTQEFQERKTKADAYELLHTQIEDVLHLKKKLDATRADEQSVEENKKATPEVKRKAQEVSIAAAKEIVQAYEGAANTASKAGQTALAETFKAAANAMQEVAQAREDYKEAIGTSNENAIKAALEKVRQPAIGLNEKKVPEAIATFKKENPISKGSKRCALVQKTPVGTDSVGHPVFFRILPATEESDLKESSVQLGYIEPASVYVANTPKITSKLDPSNVGQSQKFIPKEDITPMIQSEQVTPEFKTLLNKHTGNDVTVTDATTLYQRIRSAMGFIAKDFIVDPTEGIIRSVQCACLPAVTSWLSWWRSALFAVRTCLESIVLTGDGKTGICQEVLSVYVCDLVYDAISCFAKKYSATGGGVSSRGGIGNILGALTTAGASVQNSIVERYGTSNTFKALFADRQLVHSICLFAFTGEWIFDVGGIFEQNFPIPIKSQAIIFPATRRYVSSNLATTPPGAATFNYNVGVGLLAGANVDYTVSLLCSDDYSCDPSEGFEGGKCDCVDPNFALAKKRNIQLQGVSSQLRAGELLGDKGQGVVFNENMQAPVRYDKVRVEWRYQNKEGAYVTDFLEQKIKQVGGMPPAYCTFRPSGYLCDISYGTYDFIQFVGDPVPSENIYFPGQTIQLHYVLENMFPETAVAQCAGLAVCDYTKFMRVVIKTPQGKTIYPLGTNVEESYVPINTRGRLDLIVPYAMRPLTQEDFGISSAAGFSPQLIGTGNAKLGEPLQTPLQTVNFILQFDKEIGSTYRICPVVDPKDIATYQNRALVYAKAPTPTGFDCGSGWVTKSLLSTGNNVEHGGLTIPVLSEYANNKNALFLIAYTPAVTTAQTNHCTEAEQQWTVTATLHNAQRTEFSNIAVPNPDALATKQSIIRVKCAGGGIPGLTSLVGKQYFTLLDVKEGEVKKFEYQKDILYTVAVKDISEESVTLTVLNEKNEQVCDETIPYDPTNKKNAVKCGPLWISVNAVFVAPSTPWAPQIDKASLIIFVQDPSTVPDASFENIGMVPKTTSASTGVATGGVQYAAPNIDCKTITSKPPENKIKQFEERKDEVGKTGKTAKEVILDIARQYKIHPALLATRAQWEGLGGEWLMGCIKLPKDFISQATCAATTFVKILAGTYTDRCDKYKNDPDKLFLCGNCQYVAPGFCTKDCTLSPYHEEKGKSFVSSCSFNSDGSCVVNFLDGTIAKVNYPGQCILVKDGGKFVFDEPSLFIGYPANIKTSYCQWLNYPWDTEFSAMGVASVGAAPSAAPAVSGKGSGKTCNKKKQVQEPIKISGYAKFEYDFKPLEGNSCGHRAPQQIQFMILHEGGANRNVIYYWKNPDVGLSSHFIIERDGTIFQAVDIERVAYHATVGNKLSVGVDLSLPPGFSNWKNCFNSVSKYGTKKLEFKSNAGEDCKYTQAQYDAVNALIDYLETVTSITRTPESILAHCEVAAGSRADPRGFDWAKINVANENPAHPEPKTSRCYWKETRAKIESLNAKIKLKEPGDVDDTVIEGAHAEEDAGLKAESFPTQHICPENVDIEKEDADCICGFKKLPPASAGVWGYSEFTCERIGSDIPLINLQKVTNPTVAKCSLNTELSPLNDASCSCGSKKTPTYQNSVWNDNTRTCIKTVGGEEFKNKAKQHPDCPSGKNLVVSDAGCTCGSETLDHYHVGIGKALRCENTSAGKKLIMTCPADVRLTIANQNCKCGSDNAPPASDDSWTKVIHVCHDGKLEKIP